MTRTTTSTDPTSRRARRAAERAARAGAPDRRRAGGSSRRSPLALITVAAVVVALVAIVALAVTQGLIGRSSDAPGLTAPDTLTPTGLADGRALGRADAPVTLDIWSDYQCPICDRFSTEVEPALVTRYVTTGKLRIVYHDAAFQGAKAGGSYDESVEAGAAARAAAAQGKFWPMHDWLFANQEGENVGSYASDRLRQIASAAGLDLAAYDAAMAKADLQAAVRHETTEAVSNGVNGTPTLRINGRTLVGLHTADELGAIIESDAK